MEAESSPQPINVPAVILAGDFAGWLRDAMAARGMSQRMLAMLTGMDHSTISRLASGDRVPTLGTALALIRVLERPRLHVVRTSLDAESGLAHE
jgi:transcriptional regulator with XRE-family HTH domain